MVSAGCDFVCCVCIGVVGLAGSAFAQESGEGVVVAEGFDGPQGILVTRNGSIWVIDSGVGGIEETSAVSQILANLSRPKWAIHRGWCSAPNGTRAEITMPSVVAGTETTAAPVWQF